jgi:hypothetical protein
VPGARPATARSPTLAPRSNERQRPSWRRAYRCNGHLNQDLPRIAAMPRESQAQSLAHPATVILLLWSA